MLLATTCPHCHTTFKIAKDQLKLKAGLVQCGICQQVFNGVAHLVEGLAEVGKELDQNFVQSPSASNVSPPPPSPELCLKEIENVDETHISSAHPVAAKVDLATSVCLSRSSQPIQNSTGQRGSAQGQAEVFAGIQELSFIRQAHTKKRLTWLFPVGVLVLTLLLLGQVIHHFRNVIAAAYPPSKNALVELCQYTGCQIHLPTQLNALSYEADTLHTLPREHSFELSLLLRNHSVLVQAWPYIELTLKNAQRQTVLKRVFTPAEYLRHPSESVNGFPAHQEYPVELYFEVTQVAASDYAVAIFYPSAPPS